MGVIFWVRENVNGDALWRLGRVWQPFLLWPPPVFALHSVDTFDNTQPADILPFLGIMHLKEATRVNLFLDLC